MATPNAGLCSFTGQRIHLCFISGCMRTFVYQGNSLRTFFFLVILNNANPLKYAFLIETYSQQQIFFTKDAYILFTFLCTVSCQNFLCRPATAHSTTPGVLFWFLLHTLDCGIDSKLPSPYSHAIAHGAALPELLAAATA